MKRRKDIIQKIYPFGFTNYNYTLYRDTVLKVLSIDPFKNFKSANLDKESILSLPASLEFSTHPRITLAKDPTITPVWSHVYLNFIGSCEKLITITDLCSLSLSCHFQYNQVENVYLIVLSATIRDWYFSILEGLDKFKSKESKEIICACCIHIESEGFRDLFSNYNKIISNDGLFKLQRKSK